MATAWDSAPDTLRVRFQLAAAHLPGTRALVASRAAAGSGWPQLPNDQVDRLREVAGRLPREAPDFQHLLADLKR